MDCSPPGSSVHGILQARILEWIAISFSRGLCVEGVPGLPGAPQDEAGLTRKFETSHVGGATCRMTPISRCDPIDGSPPGSPVPGILQARTLEWVAVSFSNA